MKKWLFSISLCLLAAVLIFSNQTTAHAAEGNTRYCQGCKKDIALDQWTALSGELSETVTLKSGQHYYLTGHITGKPSGGILFSGVGCFDLNGFNITPGKNCIVFSCNAGTTNIMGSGTVTGTYAGSSVSGAAINANNSSIVHLYGGTYRKTVENPTIYIKSAKVHIYDGVTLSSTGTYTTYPIVYTSTSSALFHMHGGTITGGAITGSSGGNLRIQKGTFTMDGGIISGGSATLGGNVSIYNTATFTMNGGTITGGTASKTYGGGNLYVSGSTATINGGLITQGVAGTTAYGGGNIGINTSSVTINDGVISYGKATNSSCTGGGNIYVNGTDSALNIAGGAIEYGYIAGGEGCNVYVKSGTSTLGTNAYIGDKGNETQGNIGYYVASGKLTSSARFSDNLKVVSGDVQILGGQYHAISCDEGVTCQITGGSFREDYSAYVAEGYDLITVPVANGDEYKYVVIPTGGTTDAVLVDKKGNEINVIDALSLFDPTKHSHIKLYQNYNLGAISASKVPVVDLNGYNMTISGTGTLKVYDSANDDYDTDACGIVTNNGTVKIQQEFIAPNSNHYVSVTSGKKTTMHRLEMKVSAVSVRTATAGIYYTTTMYCDDTLAGNVDTYGVVLSLMNMPGSDFRTEKNEGNLYTTATKAFQSGVSINSAVVNNIMQSGKNAATNTTYGKVAIYANPYISFKSGVTCMGDYKNADKSTADADFTGTAYSLYDLMMAFDNQYAKLSKNERTALNEFYKTWQKKGMDWKFKNIYAPADPPPSTPETDPTMNLVLTNGKGYCYACKKTVTWKALNQKTYKETPYGTAGDNTHIYLAEDITYNGTEGSAFLIAPTTEGHSACLHLNGHSLTATADRAIYGHTGILNVLGSGKLSGYAASSNQGAAIQINNNTGTGVINLYSGTYSHAKDSHETSYAISIWSNGGIVNIYDNAKVDGSANGKAIRNNSTGGNSRLGLYRATVTGNVSIAGSSTKTSELILDTAQIEGTLDLTSRNTVTLKGAPYVKRMNIATATILQLEDISLDTEITVSATGRFTTQTQNAEELQTCFRAAKSADTILIEENAFVCRATMNGKVKPNASNQATCAVCNKTVTWTAIRSGATPIQLAAGGHYYLTASLTYDGADAPFITAPNAEGKTACLHLNGYNITAKKNAAIYSNVGNLNVLGNGTVSGYAAKSANGCAVFVNGSTATINLYGGTYQKASGSHASSAAVCCGSSGGSLSLCEEARVAAKNDLAIYVSTSKYAATNLTVKESYVQGNVTLSAPAGSFATTVTINSATIAGKLDFASGVNLTLSGRPRIQNLTVAKGALATVKSLTNGADIRVSAEGAFTKATDQAWAWEGFFDAVDSSKHVAVKNSAFTCSTKTELPNGNRILVIGNSQTYYSKYVIDRQNNTMYMGYRENDQGYLYQVCKANGADVTVTNFSFPMHTLYDYYSGSCKADKGHNGYNHMADLEGQVYDYVIMQEGNEALNKTNILAECQPLMDYFRKVNPNTKFVYLVTVRAHRNNTKWMSSVKELEKAGVIVVDWGAIAYDLMTGKVTAPGGTEKYQLYSFVVNKTSVDGHHPNILSGYISAQMTFSAITGKSAVGCDYSFWNDSAANSTFDLAAYLKVFYAYDSTKPSNTNFETVFNSPTEMKGLQQLIDKYLKEKSYLTY